MTSVETDQGRVRVFCEDRDWDQFHAPPQLAIGLVTEASELLALFRFKTPEQVATLLADPAGREKVSDELADSYFFLLRFAQRNGFDLSKALQGKLAKNALKYPEEQAKGRNLKYDELPG